MATKKKSLINHTPLELNKLVENKREELRVLRFSASGSKNRNVKLARVLRKDIARAMTELNSQRLNLNTRAPKV